MDVESQETLIAVVKQAETSLKAVLDDAFVKIETVIRDGLAEVVMSLNGWQISIPATTIKLEKKV